MSGFNFLKCCKPFPGVKCSAKLIKVNPKLEKILGVESGSKICHSCYIRANAKSTLSTINSDKMEASTSQQVTPPSSVPKVIPNSDSSISTKSDDSKCSVGDTSAVNAVLQNLNPVLSMIGESPIYISQLENRSVHQQEKLTKLASTILVSPSSQFSLDDFQPIVKNKADLFDEMISQLQEKYKKLSNHSDKIQLLTVMPKSMPRQQIEKLFNTTQYMVKEAKKLQDSEGALSKPRSKIGNRINFNLQQLVIDYYNNDDVSRCMPGINHCISVQIGGKRCKVQKRLMMCTLKECYEGFKNHYGSNSEYKIGFSKFAMLRPKYCVQPGSSGTHSVCVCTIHQNVKLMHFEAKMDDITNGKLKNYKDCISAVLCAPPKPECYLFKCNNCPGLNSFREYLLNSFDEYERESSEIIFSQWISTDRCNLEKLCKPLEDFLDYFIEKLEKLIPHFFISYQQSKFIKSKKESLEQGELIIHCDFAENYSFIIQNEAQGFHWNNKQATVHPFVIYYKDSHNVLQHYSSIIISDSLTHDAVAVWLFIEKLINFLKTKFEIISKIYYITDGAASQYKNKKNFINILNHRHDFGISCEWHFHATSHGKGPCDGIGGTFKRQAARASLTREYTPLISTAKELFDWATTLQTGMHFIFSTNEEYERKKIQLDDRFKNIRAIKGTQGYHAFIPSENATINCKKYSNSEIYDSIKM